LQAILRGERDTPPYESRILLEAKVLDQDKAGREARDIVFDHFLTSAEANKTSNTAPPSRFIAYPCNLQDVIKYAPEEQVNDFIARTARADSRERMAEVFATIARGGNTNQMRLISGHSPIFRGRDDLLLQITKAFKENPLSAPSSSRGSYVSGIRRHFSAIGFGRT
jgi:hypothetical protein